MTMTDPEALLTVVAVPCLQDNYAWLVQDRATGAVAVVDVPEAAPILRALAERGWTLGQILLTHHHDDHIAGVAELVAATGAKVFCAAADAHRLPHLDQALRPGDAVRVGAERAVVLDVPGHTRGHIAFHFPEAHAAFTGDSLMAAGCGRLFEGTAAEMWASLSQFLGLPDDTLIGSGHEYAQTNLRFALSLTPDDPAVVARAADVAALRADGLPSLPVTLGEERATNPFLRAADPDYRAAVGGGRETAAETFARLRLLRDGFR